MLVRCAQSAADGLVALLLRAASRRSVLSDARNDDDASRAVKCVYVACVM